MVLKIALIQMDIHFGDPEANREKVKKLFTHINTEKTDVVILPELWNTGYDLSRLDKIADRNGQESIKFLSNLAITYDVNIIAGSIAKQDGSDVTNTMLVINKDGQLIKEYSKAHLFRLMSEDKYLVEGHDKGQFELEGQKSAGVICYDIRFPEWIRTNMLDNTKVLYVVAEWPKPRIDHWRTLLVSRAIENQCYVVACNRVGSDPNNEFGGNSLVISPWGEIIAAAGEDETILFSEIDIKQVDEIRNEIPVFTDRRPDMYK